MVDINWTIFLHVLNFLVLMFFLIKYLYKPVYEIIDKRKKKIKNDLNEAKNSKKEAKELKKEYEAKIKNARSEAQQIVEEAENRGKNKARDIISRAEKEAEKIKEKKQEEIKRAKKEALEELKKEVATISLMAASNLIQEKLDEKKHKQLIKKYIDQLNKKKLGEIK